MKVDIIIPEGLFDITLEQYQKFLQVNSEDELFLAQKCVEIFCNVPLIIVSKMSYKDVKNYAARIMSFFEDKPQLRKIHTMGDVEYGFIPNLEEISLGEYVDIDESINDWEKMHTTMAVLYRPIKSRRKDKYNIEEYEGTSDSEHRMKGLTMDVVLGALFFFLSFRDRVVDSFDSLFNGTGGEHDLSSTANFGRKWGWYTTFYHLSQGDVTRFEKVSKLRLFAALTMMTYDKEKNELEKSLLKI